MPKALIIGYAGSYAHESQVRSTFLEHAPNNWTADIAFFYTKAGTTVEELLELDNVVEVFTNQSEGNNLTLWGVVLALELWLESNPYDLIVFSWLDFSGENEMGRVARDNDIPIFLPMPNSNTEASSVPNERFITYVNYGESEALGGFGGKVDCFDNQNNTSNATPMVAGKCASLIDEGLSRKQTKIALTKACSLYPDWNNRDGYGKVPVSLSVPDDYDYIDKEGNEVVFEEEEPESEPNDPEEDNPITNPTQPTAVRTGNEITLTRNETTATVKVYRKLKERDEWELVGETTEDTFTDEIDPAKNYIYAIRLSNSETESALSEPVYIAGYKETSTVSQAIF